jgi:hypothetical protein
MSEAAALRRQIAALETQMSRLRAPMPAQERDEISAAMTRADTVAAQFGTTASQPLPGETGFQYRRRLLGSFAKHSAQFKDARIEMVDPTMIGSIEDLIYADATAAALDPNNYKPGELRAIKDRDASGREITRYVGDIAWLIRREPESPVPFPKSRSKRPRSHCRSVGSNAAECFLTTAVRVAHRLLA